jgi:hypothetical protein
VWTRHEVRRTCQYSPLRTDNTTRTSAKTLSGSFLFCRRSAVTDLQLPTLLTEHHHHADSPLTGSLTRSHTRSHITHSRKTYCIPAKSPESSTWIKTFERAMAVPCPDHLPYHCRCDLPGWAHSTVPRTTNLRRVEAVDHWSSCHRIIHCRLVSAKLRQALLCLRTSPYSLGALPCCLVVGMLFG